MPNQLIAIDRFQVDALRPLSFMIDSVEKFTTQITEADKFYIFSKAYIITIIMVSKNDLKHAKLLAAPDLSIVQ